MPLGPGKYDGLAEAARLKVEALGAVVIIIGGEHGHGFEVCGPLEVNLALPDILEEMAASIRNSLKEGTL